MQVHFPGGTAVGYAVDGVTYVPLRAICERLGYTVGWTPDKPFEATVEEKA